MAGDDEQIDGIEPRLQRRAAVLKDRSGARVDVIPASGARVCLAVRHLVKRRFNAALAAHMALAKADFHHMREAGFLIGEALEEVADRKFRGFALAHVPNLGDHDTCVKGIIPYYFV